MAGGRVGRSDVPTPADATGTITGSLESGETPDVCERCIGCTRERDELDCGVVTEIVDSDAVQEPSMTSGLKHIVVMPPRSGGSILVSLLISPVQVFKSTIR
jgi:hypothetical protein